MIDTQYEDLLRRVLDGGSAKSDRTGTGTTSVFGERLRYDLAHGFPLITTKKVHFKSVAYELLWFLRGEGNARWLQEHGVTIWDEWAAEDGSLGPVYGVQWRSWPTPGGGTGDPLSPGLQTLPADPHSRRMVGSAWNGGALPGMGVAPWPPPFQVPLPRG